MILKGTPEREDPGLNVVVYIFKEFNTKFLSVFCFSLIFFFLFSCRWTNIFKIYVCSYLKTFNVGRWNWLPYGTCNIQKLTHLKTTLKETNKASSSPYELPEFMWNNWANNELHQVLQFWSKHRKQSSDTWFTSSFPYLFIVSSEKDSHIKFALTLKIWP